MIEFFPRQQRRTDPSLDLPRFAPVARRDLHVLLAGVEAHVQRTARLHALVRYELEVFFDHCDEILSNNEEYFLDTVKVSKILAN